MRRSLALALFTLPCLVVSMPACDGNGGDGSDDGTTDDGGNDTPPPTDPTLLQAWLEGGNYSGWAKESDPHLSDGPHFGEVRVFLNDTLDASLAAGNGTHPVDSAAVKELYGSGTSVLGWAVSVKTVEGLSTDTWYWYEFYEGAVSAEGQGNDACDGCHTIATDHIQSVYPLQ